METSWSCSDGSGSSCTGSDEEVGVSVRGRRLWVRGVRDHTSCSDVVRALLLRQQLTPTPEEAGDCGAGEWVLAERWRGVERPLSGSTKVLDVLSAWGDATHEVRLSLRYVEGGDSGRESEAEGADPPPQPAPRPPTPPAARLAAVIARQSRTLHQQIDKLREQEKQIDHLEDQAHKERMEKHGCNYLLESYLRDLGRCTEQATDSQAGNSDSGVGGGSGTPPHNPRPPRAPRRHAKRRERHLLREHYFTKELTDICQINSDRITARSKITDDEDSGDDLGKLKEEIEIWEKMAIVNKRLQKEEELLVRLGAKLKRYLNENRVTDCDNVRQITDMLEKVEEDLEGGTREIQTNTAELERVRDEVELRKKFLEDLSLELEREEVIENQCPPVEIHPANSLYDHGVNMMDAMPESFENSLNGSVEASGVAFYELANPIGYALDTLV